MKLCALKSLSNSLKWQLMFETQRGVLFQIQRRSERVVWNILHLGMNVIPNSGILGVYWHFKNIRKLPNWVLIKTLARWDSWVLLEKILSFCYLFGILLIQKSFFRLINHIKLSSSQFFLLVRLSYFIEKNGSHCK